MSTTTGPDSKIAAALGSGERPPRASAGAASLTFGWRALLKIKHVPEQLFDVTMFPVMFILMFTYVFGGAIADSPSEYLPFVFPGILVQTVLMITMYTAMTVNNDIKKGVFDRIRSLPIWRPSLLVGSLLGDMLRYTMACAVIFTIALLMGYRAPGGFTGALATVALLLVFCFSLSWVWTLLGLKMRTQESLMGVSMMILFPLTFISNVFVPADSMPGWLEAFVSVNPVSHLVDAARGFLGGSPDGQAVVTVLLMSAALIVVFGPLTMRAYNRKS